MACTCGGRAGRILLGAAAGLVGAGAGVFAGALAEAHAFHVVSHEVPVRGLRDSGTGLATRLRVLHLSDVHYVPGQLDKLRFIAGLADLHPDLVICTGDLLSHDDGIDELTGALTGLFEFPGVFVFGSNDMFASRAANPLHYLVAPSSESDDQRNRDKLDWRRQRSVLLDAGWADLNNHRAIVDAGGASIELRGTGDAHIDLDNYASVAGPASPGLDLSLGVTHSPYRRVLDAMCADGLPLVFAGHTHGGQVCLPGGRALTSNCDLDPSLASGLHWYTPALPRPLPGGRVVEDGTWLHVTRGVGTSPTAPYRLFCRPEACLVELIGI